MFAVFAGDHYYPGGGWEDFKGEAETKEGALKVLRILLEELDWGHTVDTRTRSIVIKGERKYRKSSLDTEIKITELD
jgi:hypothetical protein